MPTDPSSTGQSARPRWSIMIISLVVTASSFLFINGVAFLIPALEAGGIPLTEAGLLASMPSWGMVVTLVLLGLPARPGGRADRADRGLGAHRGGGLRRGIGPLDGRVGRLLFVGGMAAASCNTAGGRLVSGWFPPDQRGLAMGIRQTAQPLGIALGALGDTRAGRTQPASGLLFPALLCTVSAWPARSASSTRRGNPGRRPPRRNWPTRIAGRACCGESTRSPGC